MDIIWWSVSVGRWGRGDVGVEAEREWRGGKAVVEVGGVLVATGIVVGMKDKVEVIGSLVVNCMICLEDLYLV